MIMRSNFRVILGTLLILLGGVLLLERLGYLHGLSNFFWGAILLIGGAFFTYVFFSDVRNSWWAVIPGFTLLGLSVDAFLPVVSRDFGRAMFLAPLGLSFLVVYLTDRARWWGIIPGGVLLTLAVVTLVTPRASGIDSGAVFFLGLGLTFLLVAILPNPVGGMQWAYIPAMVLILMGALLGSSSMTSLADYLWPVVLIVFGAMIILRFFLRRE
jgi:hypothetical protein